MTTFDDQRKKAFDFCADATKQLITLASGFILLTITFAKDFIVNVAESSKVWAYWSWAFYALCIISGMLTLLAMTAELEPAKSTKEIPTIRKAVATWSLVQVSSFGIAIIFTVVFGICAAKNSKGFNNSYSPKAGLNTGISRHHSSIAFISDDQKKNHSDFNLSE
jgi:hypothetical protein